jgi:hypothetical protein
VHCPAEAHLWLLAQQIVPQEVSPRLVVHIAGAPPPTAVDWALVAAAQLLLYVLVRVTRSVSVQVVV